MTELTECFREVSWRSAWLSGALSAPCWSDVDLRSARYFLERGLSLARSCVVTLLIAVAVAATFASDGATALLEGSRGGIADGEWRRIFTGHATHWSADHLGWDLFMFVVLGAVLERRKRGRFVGLLVGSAAAISASVFLLQPEIDSYRGLSGVDSALFVAVCMDLIADARRNGKAAGHNACLPSIAAALLLVAFVGKTIFEYATGDTLFVASSTAGFTPLPLAHVAGAAAAMASWAISRVASGFRRKSC